MKEGKAMNGWIILLFILILICVWLRIDFLKGMRRQQKQVTKPSPQTRYSDVELLALGDIFFYRLIHDMRQARNHIHLLFYIFRNDHIGNKLMDLLEAKAKEGITVRVLVDWIGADLPRKKVKQLKRAGVKFAYSHSPTFPFFFFTLNQRNHRKVVVIDGVIGYIGGYNIGDEYLGRDPRFGLWRDFNLRLEKDGVQDLQAQFLKDWGVATNSTITDDSYYPPLTKGASSLKILPTNGVYLESIFADFMKQAKKEIIIGTPYYIPSQLLQQELINAAKRGVDVKLLVPKKADHPLVKEASFPYYPALLQAGVDIYQYYRGFYHVKVLVVDEQICDVGTANFDKRSFHMNSEINCLITDPALIETVLREIRHDISISERLTIDSLSSRSLIDRGKEKIATLVSGLL